MTANIDKQKNPSEQPEGEHLPVFNPNRWLWDFEGEKPKKLSGPSGPVKRRNPNQMMMWNLISSVMDFLFVAIACFLFLWVSGRLFDTSVRNTLMGLWKISPTGTVVLFYSFLWLYHVAMPALFYFTLGQWACQITRSSNRITFTWILKSTFRLVILFMTGFIVIPLFSWASGIDLEESLTGLKITAVE